MSYWTKTINTGIIKGQKQTLTNGVLTYITEAETVVVCVTFLVSRPQQYKVGKGKKKVNLDE